MEQNEIFEIEISKYDNIIDEIKNNNKNINNNFIALIISFTIYLNKNKYQISAFSIINFFKLVPEFNVFKYDEIKSILKLNFCKNQMQIESFDSFFKNYFFNNTVAKDTLIKELQKVINEKQQEQDKTMKDLNEEFSKLNKELQNQKQKELESIEELKNINILESIKIKISKDKKELLNNKKESDNEYMDRILTETNLQYLKTFINLQEEEIKKELSKYNDIEKLKDDFNKIMFHNITTENNETFNKLCLSSSELITKVFAKITKLKKEQDKTVEEKEQEIKRKYQRKQQDLFNKVEDEKRKSNNEILEIKEKLTTLQHRTEFDEGKNAIKTIEKIKDKAVNSLSINEYTILLDYIRLNSAKFRTKISRSMKKSKNKVFDYKKTIQKSVKTYGDPIELYYKKPIIKKYKIICIVDVSGSVKKYFKLLLSFIYEISKVFNGGVYSFSFVRNIKNITDIIKDNSIEDGIEIALQDNRDYSDYNTAFKQFCENYLSMVDKNTIILILGDARNNKNDSGIKYLSQIKERAKLIIWLNPDKKEKWDKGDSIISKYKSYISELYPSSTVEDIINFLNNFSIKEKK